MRRALISLFLGEALLLWGLSCWSYAVAAVVAGVQLVSAAVLYDDGRES